MNNGNSLSEKEVPKLHINENHLKNKRKLMNKTKSICPDEPFGAIFLRQVVNQEGIEEVDEDAVIETPTEIRA